MAWGVGVVLGALDGFLLFEFPLLGLGLLAAGALLLGRQQAWRGGLGGMACGLGGLWLLVLSRAKLACDAVDRQPESGCSMAGVELYLAVSAIVLLAGVGLTVLAWRSTEHRRD